MNIYPGLEASLDFDDIFIIPRGSKISTRASVDIKSKVKNKTWQVPIMPANMLDITTESLAKAVLSSGGTIGLHRFQTINEACTQFKNLNDFFSEETINNNLFVSVGVNRDSKDRVTALYNCGARNFIIDIAHGHSELMTDMIQWIKQNFQDVYIMAGNVATKNAVIDLANSGADAIKCGIGPGAACLTKNITGVTVPQVSCIIECVKGKKQIKETSNIEIAIVADGGVKEIGDVCKALALGADLVMAGKLFAGCQETLNPGIYSGSASSVIQTLYRSDKEYLPTPEGETIQVEKTNDSASKIIHNVAGGIRSSCSYVGASNLETFQKNVLFGIRHNKKW